MQKDQQLKQQNNSEQLSVKLRNTKSNDEVSVEFVETFICNTRHKFYTHQVKSMKMCSIHNFKNLNW